MDSTLAAVIPLALAAPAESVIIHHEDEARFLKVALPMTGFDGQIQLVNATPYLFSNR